MICECCQIKQATYISPKNLCDDCWAAWFIEDYEFKTTEEREEFLREIRESQLDWQLKNIDKSITPDPKGSGLGLNS